MTEIEGKRRIKTGWTAPLNNVGASTHARAVPWPMRDCIVRCECGHESLGHYFGAVWLKTPSPLWHRDAWRVHRRHTESVHGTDYSVRVDVPPDAIT